MQLHGGLLLEGQQADQSWAERGCYCGCRVDWEVVQGCEGALHPTKQLLQTLRFCLKLGVRGAHNGSSKVDECCAARVGVQHYVAKCDVSMRDSCRPQCVERDQDGRGRSAHGMRRRMERVH